MSSIAEKLHRIRDVFSIPPPPLSEFSRGFGVLNNLILFSKSRTDKLESSNVPFHISSF